MLSAHNNIIYNIVNGKINLRLIPILIVSYHTCNCTHSFYTIGPPLPNKNNLVAAHGYAMQFAYSTTLQFCIEYVYDALTVINS